MARHAFWRGSLNVVLINFHFLNKYIEDIMFGYVMVIPLHITHIYGMVFQVAGQQRKFKISLENWGMWQFFILSFK
jgi:hypothetical protein